MVLHLRRVLSAVAAVLLIPQAADACPICFGGVHSPLVDSARLGVLVMAAVTVCVLSAFGLWFVRLARLESTITETATSIGDPQPDSSQSA